MIAGTSRRVNICHYIKEDYFLTDYERFGFSHEYKNGCSCKIGESTSDDQCAWNKMECQTNFGACIKKSGETKCSWSIFEGCLKYYNQMERSTRSTIKPNQHTNAKTSATSTAKPQEEKQHTSESAKHTADFGSPTSPEITHNAKKPAPAMSTITIDDIQRLLDTHNNKIAETIKITVHNELMSFSEQL